MKQFILISIMLFSSAAHTQPGVPRTYPDVKGDVKEGSVNFIRTKKEITIKSSSDRALIDFFSFSVFGTESVRINQPSKNSVMILRLPVELSNNVNPNMLYLRGELSSNGKIIIIAPEGVSIKSGAKIDAPSVLITTADMKESDWQIDDFRFEDVLDYWGEIENEGVITTRGYGSITIAGDRISNEGSVLAGGNNISLVTASAFTYSVSNNAIRPDSIRTVAKKQSLLNKVTKATVINNSSGAKIIAQTINVDVNIDNNDRQTPVLLEGSIDGSLQVTAKARGWLWLDGNVASREGSINIYSTDDVWFGENTKLSARTINAKADDELRCRVNEISTKAPLLDASDDRGNAGTIRLEAKRMTLSGRLTAVGKVNGGEITVISSTEPTKSYLKTDVAGHTGKAGVVSFKGP
ncbi:hypothetical protein [Bdellovibrio sp. HCB209]|uniref:two-partner secretion domain-containing protein n=1 Tax=Bdellovibrio sp. HCB209 TaxID=3394354 RepID=UPI0039B68F58